MRFEINILYSCLLSCFKEVVKLFNTVNFQKRIPNVFITRITSRPRSPILSYRIFGPTNSFFRSPGPLDSRSSRTQMCPSNIRPLLTVRALSGRLSSPAVRTRFYISLVPRRNGRICFSLRGIMSV